jgi:DNA ligase 1
LTACFPDIFIEPAIVIEVLDMEITKSPSHTAGEGKGETGLALRFPRFLHIRRDKGPYEATTVKEIWDLGEDLKEKSK